MRVIMSGCLSSLCSPRARNLYLSVGAIASVAVATANIYYSYNQSTVIDRVSTAVVGCVGNNTANSCCATAAAILKDNISLPPKLTALLSAVFYVLFGGVAVATGYTLLPSMCNAKDRQYRQVQTAENPPDDF
jgi:hypothetical protein